MATVDELLDGGTEHIHEVVDTNVHFVIDASTHAITYPDDAKIILIQGDHNSTVFTFDLPRYIDGHDMSTCNVVQVHYTNIGANGEQHPDREDLKDLQVNPDNDQLVMCSWKVRGSATINDGITAFMIRYACMSSSTFDYVWNTAIFDQVIIGKGMNNSDVLYNEYFDVLNQWKEELAAEFASSYLSNKGGRLAGKLLTRDVYVGGALDAYGEWGPRNPFIVDHTPLYESVKNGVYISTMNIQEAGHYHLILPEGSNYLYKMQITEGNITRVFDVDQMPVIAAGTYSDTDWYDAGDGIQVIFSAKTRVDSNSKTFEDGFVGKKRLNFQKETEYEDDNPDNPYPAVEFYTEGQAEVTIWWVAGDNNRFFAIQSEKCSGASRLEVSGTFIAHGNAGVKNTLSTRHLRVEEKTELSGGLGVGKDIDVGGTAKVGNDLTVNGFISCGESLRMNGNDIKDVQSIEVDGTAKLLNDVMIKHNTSRDHTIKLSTVLDEAFDYNFKNRIYVDKVAGETFDEQLANAISEVADGGVIVIPSGAYTYHAEPILIENKSISIIGVGKEKPTIDIAGSTIFDVRISTLPVTATWFNCVNVAFSSESSSNPIISLNGGLGMPIDNVHIADCDFDGCIDFCYVRDITVEGCVFTGARNNILQIKGDGANPLEKFTITNCSLSSSTSNNGGSIYMQWGSTCDLLIQNSAIDDEYCCVRAVSIGKLYVLDSKILNQSDYQLINVQSCSIIGCERSHFESDTSYLVWGGVYATVYFIGCNLPYMPTFTSSFTGKLDVIGCKY